MPRKSSAALSVVSIDVARVPPRPPESLDETERETFVELASHATHLKPADVPLLASLAQAIVLSRRLARDPARVAEWERATRTQMALTRSLRMSPQSRIDARAAGRHDEPSGPNPW
jgi:hypothetical protein